MKTPLHARNTARPLSTSAILREVLGSVFPGSSIAPAHSSRFFPRLQGTAGRGGAIRLC
jgi:hypothetical protein